MELEDRRSIREILNEIKWSHQALDEVEIHYVHRHGTEKSLQILKGSRIREISSAGLIVYTSTLEGYLPYHRIELIVLRGEIMLDRRKPKNEEV